MKATNINKLQVTANAWLAYSVRAERRGDWEAVDHAAARVRYYDRLVNIAARQARAIKIKDLSKAFPGI